MPTQIGWKIWFADDTTMSSKDNTWEDIPQEGLLVMYRYFDDGTREHISGQDVYPKDEAMLQTIKALDNDVKLGSAVDDAAYYAIHAIAVADTEAFV